MPHSLHRAETSCNLQAPMHRSATPPLPASHKVLFAYSGFILLKSVTGAIGTAVQFVPTSAHLSKEAWWRLFITSWSYLVEFGFAIAMLFVLLRWPRRRCGYYLSCSVLTLIAYGIGANLFQYCIEPFFMPPPRTPMPGKYWILASLLAIIFAGTLFLLKQFAWGVASRHYYGFDSSESSVSRVMPRPCSLPAAHVCVALLLAATELWGLLLGYNRWGNPGASPAWLVPYYARWFLWESVVYFVIAMLLLKRHRPGWYYFIGIFLIKETVQVCGGVIYFLITAPPMHTVKSACLVLLGAAYLLATGYYLLSVSSRRWYGLWA